MPLAHKPFAEFAAELAAGLATGRGDEPLAESVMISVTSPRHRSGRTFPGLIPNRGAALRIASAA